MRTRRLVPAVALTLLLVGCSGTDTDEATPPVQEQTAEEQEPEDRPSKEPVADDEVEEEALGGGLDAFVEAERATIPAILDASAGMYSEIDIVGIQPDTVEYSYVYAEPIDAAAALEYFESMIDTIQELCEAQVFPAMERAGVTGSQKVRYTYYNPDGSELWSHLFES